MPVRPAIRPADRIERRPKPQAKRDSPWLVFGGAALFVPRKARHRHGASVRPPLLRASVSSRSLRHLRYLPADNMYGSGHDAGPGARLEPWTIGYSRLFRKMA